MNVKKDVVNARRQDEHHYDGNSLGGVLADIFGRDVTAGEARCGACGAHNAVGALTVYNRPPDQVVSCPGCGADLMVVVHRPGAYRLTFHELRSLEMSDT
jgi:hypothetical protein